VLGFRLTAFVLYHFKDGLSTLFFKNVKYFSENFPILQFFSDHGVI